MRIAASLLFLHAVLASGLAEGPGGGAKTPVPQACLPGKPVIAFIVATGRSGSTSLLNLLREIPGSNFLGENGGVLDRMFFLDHDLLRARELSQREGDRAKLSPWIYNALANREVVLDAYRQLLFVNTNWDTGPNVTLIGFKEVRWNYYADLNDVDFLLELFPCAKLLLSYRTDVETQVQSGFWKFRNRNVSKVVKELLMSNAALLRLHERRRAETRLVPLPSIANVTELQSIIDWLGFGERCRVTGVPHANPNGTLDVLGKVDRCNAVQCTRNPGYKNQYLACT